MKSLKLSLLTLILPFFGSLADACPDLTGTYMCAQSAEHPDLLYTMSRTPFGANWTFKVQAALADGTIVNEYEFSTDGVDRDVYNRISRQRVHIQASCDATTLMVSGTAETVPAKPLQISEKLSLTPEGNLSNYSLNSKGVVIHEVCQRQP